MSLRACWLSLLLYSQYLGNSNVGESAYRAITVVTVHDTCARDGELHELRYSMRISVEVFLEAASTYQYTTQYCYQ